MPKKKAKKSLAIGEYADEDDIPNFLYDFQKEEDDDEEFVLDDKDKLPYRHITNWYLAKIKTPTLRLPLPTKCTSFRGIALFGELVACPREVKTALAEGKDRPPNKKVVIRRTIRWSIDMTHCDRGIWFETHEAWYKLIQPSNEKPNGTALSQEDVHLPMRAKFGLVSNIYDMFGERSLALNLKDFIPIHNNRLPSDSYKLLSPNKEIMAKYSGLNTEPFDLELLRREPAFVKDHLKDFDRVNLTAASRFMQGLTDMERARKKRNGGLGEEPFDFLASAERAEKRSKRMPWGCMMQGEQYTHINRLIEIKVALKGATMSESKNDGEVRSDSVASEQSSQKPKPNAQNISHHEPQHPNNSIVAEQPSQPGERKVPPESQRPDSASGATTDKTLELMDQAAARLEAKATCATGGAAAAPVDKRRREKEVNSGKTRRAEQSKPSSQSTSRSRSTELGSKQQGRKRPRPQLPMVRNVSPEPELRDTSDSENEEWSPTEPGQPNNGRTKKQRVAVRETRSTTGRSADASRRRHLKRIKSNSSSVGYSSDDSYQGQNECEASSPSRTEMTPPLRVVDTSPNVILTPVAEENARKRLRLFLDDDGKCIKERRADAFIKACVTCDSVASYESMLVCINCLRHSSPQVRLSLFDNENPFQSGCRNIFIAWLDEAMKRMEDRRNDKVSMSIIQATINTKRTEEEIAIAIMRLIKACCGPAATSTGLYPDQISNLYGVDPIECVEKTYVFAQRYKIIRLIDAGWAVKNHLKRLAKESGSGSSGAGNPSEPFESSDGRENVNLARADSFGQSERLDKLSRNKLIRDGDLKKMARQEMRANKTKELQVGEQNFGQDEVEREAQQVGRSLKRPVNMMDNAGMAPKLGRAAAALSGKTNAAFTMKNRLLTKKPEVMDASYSSRQTEKNTSSLHQITRSVSGPDSSGKRGRSWSTASSDRPQVSRSSSFSETESNVKRYRATSWGQPGMHASAPGTGSSRSQQERKVSGQESAGERKSSAGVHGPSSSSSVESKAISSGSATRKELLVSAPGTGSSRPQQEREVSDQETVGERTSSARVHLSSSSSLVESKAKRTGSATRTELVASTPATVSSRLRQERKVSDQETAGKRTSSSARAHGSSSSSLDESGAKSGGTTVRTKLLAKAIAAATGSSRLRQDERASDCGTKGESRSSSARASSSLDGSTARNNDKASCGGAVAQASAAATAYTADQKSSSNWSEPNAKSWEESNAKKNLAGSSNSGWIDAVEKPSASSGGQSSSVRTDSVAKTGTTGLGAGWGNAKVASTWGKPGNASVKVASTWGESGTGGWGTKSSSKSSASSWGKPGNASAKVASTWGEPSTGGWGTNSTSKSSASSWGKPGNDSAKVASTWKEPSTRGWGKAKATSSWVEANTSSASAASAGPTAAAARGDDAAVTAAALVRDAVASAPPPAGSAPTNAGPVASMGRGRGRGRGRGADVNKPAWMTQGMTQGSAGGGGGDGLTRDRDRDREKADEHRRDRSSGGTRDDERDRHRYHPRHNHPSHGGSRSGNSSQREPVRSSQWQHAPNSGSIRGPANNRVERGGASASDWDRSSRASSSSYSHTSDSGARWNRSERTTSSDRARSDHPYSRGESRNSDRGSRGWNERGSHGHHADSSSRRRY